MRRLLASCLGVFLLALGPVYPYVHLAMEPHYLCPEHGVFERSDAHSRWSRPATGPRGRLGETASSNDAPDSDPRPGSPGDSHETCTLANLTLASALPAFWVQPTSMYPAPRPAARRSRRAPREIPRRWLLSVAPKASPPHHTHLV